MDLKIIGSNSGGNAYILETATEALLLECGVRFDKIKKALNFNLAKVRGCLISHSHGDHASAIHQVLAAGIDVYSSAGTFRALQIDHHHRAKAVGQGIAFKIGGFRVKPFHVEHDADDPYGYLINHPECGNVLFITDTHYVPFRFHNLNNIIIEANYSEKIITEKMWDGSMPGFLRKRILETHMSIETCQEFLAQTDLTKVINIVLIHLSDANSDAAAFQREVAIQTGATVTAADRDMTIPFNLQPF